MDREVAEKIVKIVLSINDDFDRSVQLARGEGTPTEAAYYTHVVSTALTDLFAGVLNPVLRAYPELTPERFVTATLAEHQTSDGKSSPADRIPARQEGERTNFQPAVMDKSLAAKLADTALSVGAQLNEAAYWVRNHGTKDEVDHYIRILSTLFVELMIRVLNPIYRLHPDLAPADYGPVPTGRRDCSVHGAVELGDFQFAKKKNQHDD